jgi:hypothetical protein
MPVLRLRSLTSGIARRLPPKYGIVKLFFSTASQALVSQATEFSPSISRAPPRPGKAA